MKEGRAREENAPPRRMRLGVRLILGFGLLCATLIAIGIVSFSNVRMVEQAHGLGKSPALREIRILLNLSTDTRGHQIEILRYALTPDRAGDKEQPNSALQAMNSDRMDGYDNLAEEREVSPLRSELSQRRTDYFERTKRLLEMAWTKPNAEVAAYALAEQVPAYNQYQVAIAALLRAHEMEERNASAATTAQLEKARAVEYILVAFAILVAAGTGATVWQTVRRLKRDKQNLQVEVGEHKRAKEAWRESESRFRVLVDHSPDAIFVVRENKIVFANPATLKMLGAARLDQLLGRRVDQIIHPEERAEVAQRTKEINEGKQPPAAKRRLLRLDGSTIEVESRVSSFTFEGKPARQVIARDNTERRMAAEKLAAQEKQYRLLFDDNPTPMWVYDPESRRILAVNQAAVAHYGFSREEFLAGTLDLFHLPEDRRALAQSITPLSAPVKAAGEWRHVKKDGSVITVEVFSSPTTFENKEARMALAIDQTERVESERKIRVSEANLALAQRVARVGSWEYQLTADDQVDETTMLCSREAYRMFGRSPEGEPLTTERFYEIVHPEDRKFVAERFFAFKEGRQPFDLDYRIILPDGAERFIHSVAEVIRDPVSGKRFKVVGTVFDITERKAAEEKLREAEEKYHSIFDNAMEGIFQNTAEGTLISANPALARMLGFDSPAEMISARNDLAQQAYADPKQREELQRLLKENGGVLNNYEYELRRKDGTFISVSENVRIVHDATGREIYEGSMQDITERKQAETALRRSNERFRSFIQATSQIVWQSDPAGKVLEDMPTWREYTGQTLEEILGFGWSDAVHPEDRQLTFERWAECIEKKSFCELEYRLRRADGVYRLFLARGVPVFDAQGAIREWVGTSTDITERKQSEEALYQSRHMLRSVLDNIPQRVFWKDRKSTYLGCNRAFALDAGFAEPEAAVGKTDDDAAWSEHAEAYRADDRVVMETGKPKLNYEEPLTDTQGQAIWLKTNKVPLFDADGTVTGVLGTYEDVTARKHASQRIAEQAELINQARDAIIVRDLQGRILFWNKGAERVYGWAEPEVVGHRAKELLYAPTDTAEFDHAISETVTRGEFRGELPQVTKSGNKITVSAHWTLVRDEQGNPKSVLAINTDITGQKKIEEQFLRAQRLESIGTLASGVAHDLNNILLPITMAAPILRAETDPAERDRFLDIVEASAQRGAAVIKQVLTFARGADGDRVLLQPIYLLEEISKIASQTFPKSISLRTCYDENIRSLEGDATQLHQVLLNLCINARDAMPNGGELCLAVENFDLPEAEAAKIPDATAGPHVAVEVTDSGTGIPESVIEKIFDPFFTTKTIGKGTGLGLSTVAGIVKSHGGFLRVSSVPGRTSFKIFLPAKETVNVAVNLQSDESIPRGQGQTIMVVDDEPTIREVAQLILKDRGYQLLLAEDGPTALGLFARDIGQVAVVVTDLAMPIMDGLMLVRSLRRMDPNIRIIISTGRDEDFQSKEMVELAVDGYLTKPYSTRQFLLKVQEVLQGGMQRAA